MTISNSLQDSDDAAPAEIDAPAGGANDDAQPDDEISVAIGSAEDAEESSVIKKIRAQNKAAAAELAEAKRKLAALTKPEDDDPGQKPTFEDCDFDAEKFSEKLLSWTEKNIAKRSKLAEKEAEEANSKQEWEADLAQYNAKKEKLGADDFEQIESIATASLSTPQQAIIVQAAKNPALVIYTLGKNEAALEKLARIKNLAKFTSAIAELESKISVKHKTAPPIETKIKSSGGSTAADAKLAALRKEATETGNFSKLVAFKKSLKVNSK